MPESCCARPASFAKPQVDFPMARGSSQEAVREPDWGQPDATGAEPPSALQCVYLFSLQRQSSWGCLAAVSMAKSCGTLLVWRLGTNAVLWLCIAAVQMGHLLPVPTCLMQRVSFGHVHLTLGPFLLLTVKPASSYTNCLTRSGVTVYWHRSIDQDSRFARTGPLM